MTTNGHLQFQVHISEPVPFSSPETAPNGERQMFQYIATTLISGERDAVLVDPPMTTGQTAQDQVDRSKRQVTQAHVHYARARGPLVRNGPAAQGVPRCRSPRRPGHDRDHAASRLGRGPRERLGQAVPRPDYSDPAAIDPHRSGAR
jgi:hypothetical protein